MAGLERVVVQTKSTEELERIEDSNRMRRELLPVHLIERVGLEDFLLLAVGHLWLLRVSTITCVISILTF